MIILNIRKNSLAIGNCKNMTVKSNVKNVGSPVKRIVRSKKNIKIPTKFNSVIPFKLRGKNGGLPLGRDFIFIF